MLVVLPPVTVLSVLVIVAVVLPVRLPPLPPALVVDVIEIVGNRGIAVDDELKDAELPTSLAGIADPIPELVNGVGKASVDVFGSLIMSP